MTTPSIIATRRPFMSRLGDILSELCQSSNLFLTFCSFLVSFSTGKRAQSRVFFRFKDSPVDWGCLQFSPKSFRIRIYRTFSRNSFRMNTYQEQGERAHFAQFWCNISPFRINTYKSVSKRTTLTSFRINTYEKQVG